MPYTSNSPWLATDGALLIQGKNRRKQASAPTQSTLRSRARRRIQGTAAATGCLRGEVSAKYACARVRVMGSNANG